VTSIREDAPPRRVAGRRARRTLADAPPALQSELHGERNGSLRADQLSAGSSQRVWWRCADGHEWQASVGSRVGGSRCPFCTGRRPTRERNLEVCFPAIAAEWHAERNAPMGPAEVTPASARVVWWHGPCGHNWQMAVSARTRRGRTCPVCTRRARVLALQGVDAAPQRVLTKHFPHVVADWHPTRNDPPTRVDLMAKGTSAVWWLCEHCGQEWRATVRDRSAGGGCPSCGATWPRKGARPRAGPTGPEPPVPDEGTSQSNNQTRGANP